MAREDDPILALARSLLSAETQEDLFRKLVSAIREGLEATGVAVWSRLGERGSFSLEASLPAGHFSAGARHTGGGSELLADAASQTIPRVLRDPKIAPPALRHLDARVATRIHEVACVPFQIDEQRTGLVEVIRETPTPEERRPQLQRYLSAVAALAGSAAARLSRARDGSESRLAAIQRLTQLYDVARVFHASLDRDDLLPAIADRIGLILDAAQCRIWLPAEDGESLECPVETGGGEAGPGREAGAAVAGDACGQREVLLIPVIEESDLDESVRESYARSGAGSLLCAPLVADETRLGAIEITRTTDRRPFDDDDRDFFEELAGEAARALRNANLFAAEAKARELDALLDISREITSTLDLDRVLVTIANRAHDIVPCDRCAILIEDGTRIEVRAVSDQIAVDRKDPKIRDLEEILSWAHMGGQGLYIAELDGEIETEREETREKFRRYFERSGMKTFVSLPLTDEEGQLGTISIESEQPYFVSEDKLEVFKILANQATVAIRNASLYRQIPLINLMAPVVNWKTRLGKIPRWTWLRNAVISAVAIAILVFVPWNLKIGGEVTVLPARNSSIPTEIEGVVESVHRREGDRVRKGDLLATLMEKDYRVRMEEVRARHDIAGREVADLEARLDQAGASQARIRQARWKEELDLLRYKLEKTRVVSPVEGIVITPRLEQKVGMFLERGEEFCRVADMSRIAVEIRVPETEIGEIRQGQTIRFKIDSYPTETFLGEIDIIGQEVVQNGRHRALVLRAGLEPRGRSLMTGMGGRARIEVGRRSIGYVLLRRPARYVWRTIWAWLP